MELPTTFKAGRIARFVAKTKLNPETGCLEWTGCLSQGYAATSIGGKPIHGHRLVYMLKHGPLPPGQVVRHRCDNPRCVRPDHLEAGTHAQNMADRAERGGPPRPYGRLTERDRADIAALHEGRRNGICLWATFSALAEIFSVSVATIQTVVKKARKAAA